VQNPSRIPGEPAAGRKRRCSSNTVVLGRHVRAGEKRRSSTSRPLLFLALAVLPGHRGAPWLYFVDPGGVPFTWKAAAAGALAGVFLFSGYLFQKRWVQLTTAPRSAFITGLTSVMVPLLAALVYRKQAPGFRGGLGAGGLQPGWP